MSTFGSQTFINELHILLETLKREKHPAVYRILPYYQDQYLQELKDCSATLNCIRQELSGLQYSIQNLTMLVVSQQQQLNHPSNCAQFSLHTVATQQISPSYDSQTRPTLQNPTVIVSNELPKKRAKPRNRKIKINQSTPSEESSIQQLKTPEKSNANDLPSTSKMNLEQIVHECCTEPITPVTFDMSLLN